MRSDRSSRGVALAAAAMLALAGCAVPAPGAAQASSPPPATQPPTDDLARFYEQTLAWEDCPGMLEAPTQCATLQVPIDYDSPDDGSIDLAVLRVAASGRSQGALLVNPGGPGGSAVEYARAADFVVSPDVRKEYDVVGVDPRGVGESAPIECVDDVALDEMLGLDPTPDTPEEEQRSREVVREFGQACERKYPELLPHLSTVEAARDMDVLRAVLGEEQLTYLGKSYGSFLGATYAGLFPERVGRLVLDGAVPPDLTNEEMNLGQAVGFETATRAYVADCIAQGECPLGTDLDGGMQVLRDLLERVDSDPLPVTDDARVRELNEAWAGTGLARAMYDQSAWPGLTDALRAALDGDGTPLFQLAREYADRTPEGAYLGNIMQVISAVNCLDRPATRLSDEEMQRQQEEFVAQAPTWGESMVGSPMCEEWPVRTDAEPEPIAAEGSGPIVVIGTTRDPATPYAWAQRLADQLEGGRLITFDGDGHTAYLRSNQCVDDAVDAFFLHGEAPEDGLTC